MKRYIKSSIIILAALAIASCSKTEEFQYNPDSALQIASVSGISPFALMQEPASKAVISGETLPGDEAAKGIGLFVTAQGGGAYDGKTTGYSNVKYAYGSEKWSAASPIYLSNTTGKLYAYFPYSADATNLTAIPVESSLNGTDYLYATSQDVSFSNKSVNLQMNHALARLHLTIKKGSKYLSDCNLSKVVLQSKAIDASGTMDITTGAVTATKAADAIGTFTLTGSDPVTAAGITKDILLVPASDAEGKKDLTLTLTIDGVDAEVKFTADKGLDIRSGIQCNATLTIEDTGIQVTGVGVGVWGDGGSQTVQVSGHTVTVKISEDTGIADDVLTNVKVDGKNVKISAVSRTKKELSCSRSDIGIIPSISADNFYDFLIDNVSTDIIATVSYIRKTAAQEFTTVNGHKVTVSVADVAENDIVKSVRLIDENVIIEASSLSENFLKCILTGTAEVSRTRTGNTFTFSISNIRSDITAIVGSLPADALPGEFSVSATRKVFFSKGNLWYGKLEGESVATFHFEQNQYESTPLSNADRDNNHISHFMWCSSVERAIAIRYPDSWDSDEEEATFFAASDFTVNGFSVWSTLTKDEWAYLFNTRQQSNKFAKAKVYEMAGLLIFPDGYSLPSGYSSEGGTGMSKVNVTDEDFPEDDNIPDETWSEMEADGVVFLPAAGYRNTDFGDLIEEVGISGFYWSASSDYGRSAYGLDFHWYGVNPNYHLSRDWAYSVRLVTDVK